MKKKNKPQILKTYFHYVLQRKWLYIIVLVAVLILAFLDGYYPYLTGEIVDRLNIFAFEDGRGRSEEHTV